MPRDDREQNFDKALARHLGSPSAAQGNDCLDAETLAAYHERLLDPEEMAQHKAHIASCERCQEILAQLEATDSIPVEADRDLMLDQIVLEHSRIGNHPCWHSRYLSRNRAAAGDSSSARSRVKTRRSSAPDGRRSSSRNPGRAQA